jgi:hypothetical protein
VIGRYEAILAEVLVLSAFLPVVMGMAGNVGVQSATVAVRGLATGAIDVRDTVPLVLKELRVGLLLGGFYGVILAIYGYLMHDSLAARAGRRSDDPRQHDRRRLARGAPADDLSAPEGRPGSRHGPVRDHRHRHSRACSTIS